MSTARAPNMQKLSGETVRLLSSSQVVSCVHAVAKELIENSLDAKATNIEVKLENFGRDLIEVRDNGVGIRREDVPYFAQPHYTCKLSCFEDLTSLATYGFRGEALASIAAVACLSVTTSTGDNNIAMTYTIDHSGQVIVSKPSHLGRGTTVSVSNLFKNIPVRRQYFRNAKWCREELRKVEGVMLAFGIAHPGVRFTLKHNKNVIWQKVQTSDFKANVTLVLGATTMQQLTPIVFQSFDPMLKVHGWVPRLQGDVTQVSRATGDRLFLLVNQRPVVVKPIIQMVRQAFVEAFPSQSGRFPVAVLSVNVLPSDLDVNLETNKTSVLFQNMDFITATLSRLLEEIYFSQSETLAVKVTPNPKVQREVIPPPNRSVKEPSENEDGKATSQQSTPQSRADRGFAVGDEQFSMSKDFPDSRNGGEDVTTPVSDSKSPGELPAPNPSTSVSCCAATPEPELCEVLDISDLEETVEEFTRFSEEEEEVTDGNAEGKNDSKAVEEVRESGSKAGEEGPCRAVEQPPLKQMTLAQWSRGQAVRDSTESPVEPVKVLRPGEVADDTKAHNKEPTPHENTNSKSLKRKAPSPTVGTDSASKKKRESPQTLPTVSLLERWRMKRKESSQELDSVQAPTVTLLCDISRIEERNRVVNMGQTTATPIVDNRVIGFCDSLRCWVVVIGDNLACFNAAGYRCREGAQHSEIHDMDKREASALLKAASQDFNCTVNSSTFHTICTLSTAN